MRCQLGCRGLSTLGIASRIFHDQLDGMPEQGPAVILDRDLDAALLIDAERRIRARHDPVAAEHDRRALGNHQDTDLVGHRAFRDGCASRGHQEHAGCKRSDQSSTTKTCAIAHIAPPSRIFLATPHVNPPPRQIASQGDDPEYSIGKPHFLMLIGIAIDASTIRARILLEIG